MTAPDPDKLALYQFQSCPYCARVRAALEHMGLDIELRDILRTPAYRTELIEGGGRATVPCLRIEHDNGVVEWMYESNDIIRYLQENYGG